MNMNRTRGKTGQQISVLTTHPCSHYGLLLIKCSALFRPGWSYHEWTAPSTSAHTSRGTACDQSPVPCSVCKLPQKRRRRPHQNVPSDLRMRDAVSTETCFHQQPQGSETLQYYFILPDTECRFNTSAKKTAYHNYFNSCMLLYGCDNIATVAIYFYYLVWQLIITGKEQINLGINYSVWRWL